MVLTVQPPAPPPTLTFGLSGDSFTISWPADAVGYALEANANISGGSWVPVPSVTGNSVTVTASEASQYISGSRLDRSGSQIHW